MENNPEFYQESQGYYTTHFTTDKRHTGTDSKTGDHFIIEDLLNYPNDEVVAGDTVFDNVTGHSTDSSTLTVVDTCYSSSVGQPHVAADIGSRSLPDTQFSGELCVPYDDVAELEWLSNFVEESFSSQDLQKLQLISGMKAHNSNNSHENNQFQQENNRNNLIFNSDMAVPGKARSKRSRAAPCNWTSRLLVLSPSTTTTTTTTTTVSSESDSDIASSIGKKSVKIVSKRKEIINNVDHVINSGGDGRRCLHCATDKTPQWRTGPMGPKTLCNACGVRYKSGRLVPEYRPAASPTFVLTKHSNSHRKVLELRRQKEMQMSQQQQFLHQNMMFDVSNGDDYLIHQHIGPDYRQLI